MSFSVKMHLKKGDKPFELARVIELEPGESLQMECLGDESYTPGSFLFLQDNEDLLNKGATKLSDRRIKMSTEKFSAEHAGTYVCSASSSDSSEAVERTVVVRKRDKFEALHYAKECKSAANFCQNGGHCYVPLVGDRTPFCLCPHQFAGANCDSLTVSEFAVARTKEAFGFGGACTALLILGAILFAVLYRREKRKRRSLERKLNGLLPKHILPGDTLKVAAEMSLISAEYVDSVKTPDEESNSPTGRSFDRPNLPYASIEFDEEDADADRPQSDRPRRENAIQKRDRLFGLATRSEPISRASPC